MNKSALKPTHWFLNLFTGLALCILAYPIAVYDIKGVEGERSQWIGDLIHFFKRNGMTWVLILVFLSAGAYNLFLAFRKMFRSS
jgi:hypothetical protein